MTNDRLEQALKKLHLEGQRYIALALMNILKGDKNDKDIKVFWDTYDQYIILDNGEINVRFGHSHPENVVCQKNDTFDETSVQTKEQYSNERSS